MSRLTFLQNKIIELDDAKRMLAMWRMKGDKIVFTNGCFDILHKGHVTYLAKAAQEGTRLVIGLNTDASVREQGKGEDRPINDQKYSTTSILEKGKK
jgi:cytidyltransferase-like protein